MHYEDIERVKAHHVNTFAQRQYVIERGIAGESYMKWFLCLCRKFRLEYRLLRYDG